ncbi:hypothetical protein KI811_16000 [Geobacter hydrogenophilus]|mgnify:CR=1 FL=1|uniref:Uncharacterized protein n=1 Tax=Geobacter hydrogenophilus TaxID=40983 RepID=A0A9W6LDA3_9BACT|nr:hypothetical protein [Geobacter hydrogenophilus]MBT0895311.1 hypothetical protein [Geobacter hydrogenophilus]GLI39538.1 hypothetical protein GHYDROH2_30390 [Geobacter hydrogenophilus]
MKFRIVIAFVVTASMAFVSVVYAEDALINPCVPVNAETVKQFRQNTATLREQLSAKNLELRQQYGYDGLNTSRIDELEGQLRELKEKIKAEARKLNIEPGSCYQL